ncbi:uncharacterized protein C9orf66-like [Sapajus apella]|uniref:Uncharacterized protein C9orf66-like n=1 Tax=Sapajus apella TaxID=9515 RepID=A0A6J3EZ36_SAPAP|nr:uncharacterized protein C9orf66-like [Sapajus apella]
MSEAFSSPSPLLTPTPKVVFQPWGGTPFLHTKNELAIPDKGQRQGRMHLSCFCWQMQWTGNFLVWEGLHLLPGLPARFGGSKPRNPAVPRLRPSPPQRLDLRPCQRQTPGVRPDGSARRSPRGGREGVALTSPGAGRGLSARAPGRPPLHSAPLAGNESCASPGHDRFHFPQQHRQESESENLWEAGPGASARARAGSQRRGRRAGVCAWPARWHSGWSRAGRVPASESATHTCLGGTLARGGQARCKWKGARAASVDAHRFLHLPFRDSASTWACGWQLSRDLAAGSASVSGLRRRVPA